MDTALQKANETYEEFCDRRLDDAKEDLIVFVFLKEVRPLLEQLEEVDMFSIRRLTDGSKTFEETRRRIKAFVQHNWLTEEVPRQLEDLLYAEYQITIERIN